MYKLRQGFIIQKKGSKTTIFDPEKSVLHSFNETASYIFEQIKKGKSNEKTIEEMVKKFKIGNTEAKKDFEEFIEDLKKKKILS